MKRFLGVFLMLFALPVSAQESPERMEKFSLGILPPVIRTQQTAERSEKGGRVVNPVELMQRVLPRLEKEMTQKKWPFKMRPASELQEAYLGVVGATHGQNDEVRFQQLKPISDRVNARYLLRFTIKELTAYRRDNTVPPTTNARVNIDLYIYDRETNEFVWQKEQEASSSRGDLFASGSLGERQDQAMLNALIRAIEPFAKGERKKIGRPRTGLVATVQKVLADGKRVLLDVGSDRNVSEGDLFTSIESDCQFKVSKVLSNGSIAEIIKGTPQEKEVFESSQ